MYVVVGHLLDVGDCYFVQFFTAYTLHRTILQLEKNKSMTVGNVILNFDKTDDKTVSLANILPKTTIKVKILF